MEEFLRWTGAVGLPLVSFFLGCSIALSIIVPRDDGGGIGGATLINAAAVFLCGLQIVSAPMIEPIWLQYLLLFALPFMLALALILKPGRSPEDGE